jgi:hypothetical protein
LKLTGQTQYTISVFSEYTDQIYSAELFNNDITGTSYVLSILNGNERQVSADILYVWKFDLL